MASCRIGDKPLSEAMLTQSTDAYMWHQGRWINSLSLEECGCDFKFQNFKLNLAMDVLNIQVNITLE